MRGEPSGIFLATPERPAAGISLAVKDLFDTAGLVTTYGSILFADHVPDASAEAVRRLEADGYATVGKTNLHEFAYGVTSENPHFGAVPNPRAPGRVAGGSSGGSAAALAAGLAGCALGSDSAGSIESRPRVAASSASSRRTGWSRWTAASRSRRASTPPGQWRARPRSALRC